MKKQPATFSIFWLAFLLPLLLTACDRDGAQPIVATQALKPPVIQTRSGDCILNPGENIALGVQDPVADAKYQWSASLGSLNTSAGTAVNYTAPKDPEGANEVLIQVTIQRGEEEPLTTNFYCTIAVTPPPPPTATPPPAPTDTPLPSPTVVPIVCWHPEITAYVFPQLKDLPNQRAFAGPLENSPTVFECGGVRDRFQSEPISIKFSYHPELNNDQFGYFGIGTLDGYDISRFNEICVWAYAEQPDQVFRLKIKDMARHEDGFNITVKDPNQWSNFCEKLADFSAKGIDLTRLDNINLGFEPANGAATIWFDDFELK